MRILYSHRTKSADGQNVHIESLTNAMAADGHQITLSGPDGVTKLSITRPRKMDAGAGEKKGLLARLPRTVYELAEFAYSIPAFWRLKSASAQTHPHFIYERYNLFFLAGLWLKKQTGLPLLLEVNAPLRQEREQHDGLALDALARWAERKVWRGADALLPVTQVLAEALIAEGVAPDKIHVIPNGIHRSDFEQADGTAIREKYALTGKTVLGFTGFVRDWHGVDLILNYIAARQDLALHLLVVGDGPHVSELKSKAAELGIPEQITFTGVIQREQIPDHVAAFDIALQPRVTPYASPLKLFEYMALGKAIVAPAQPNIEEILTDGENAILFQPDHSDALYAALDSMVKDQAIRTALGANAQQAIIARDLTWEGNAKRVLRIAEQIIEQRDFRHAG